MKIKRYFIWTILTTSLLLACTPTGKEQTTKGKDPVELTSDENPAEKTVPQEQRNEEVISKYFICYTSDSNPNLAISIGFDADEKAIKVRYKGQEESMDLSFFKEDFQEGGAHPNIETYYTELYKGEKNGVYKLTHSGIWDYAEYTRKDGKKFNFTIDHELSIENDGYRTTPCF
ncbi:MAG: hypothetical protein IPL49_20460 [Saprospirales bacterium]|nr:hypothetical protein [Saprospirales bacterium]MBK8493187.1 hypothetical protein [Saprospirales bacterium]